MIERISISDYLKIKKNITLIDVRSPAEFQKGNIPGAQNIPIFNNEERAIVGTIYKQQSKEEAIKKGYEIVNPKLDWYIEEAKKITSNKNIAVHCWRGGMRSGAMGQHFADNGFGKILIIEGGYKAFRNYTFSFFEKKFKLIVLGGFTGSGKTKILHEIKKTGEQVIDLEEIANHKGSAFGGIGQKKQPSVEHFQNNIFMEMYDFDFSKKIWIEDESLNIGKVVLPKELYNQIRTSKVLFIDIPQTERAKFLLATYGKQNKDDLKESILKIKKRLGPLNTKLAISAIDKGDLLTVAKLSLIYYDKAYLKGVNKRGKNKITKMKLPKINHKENANKIIEIINKTPIINT